jgi:hypothetical protein
VINDKNDISTLLRDVVGVLTGILKLVK